MKRPKCITGDGEDAPHAEEFKVYKALKQIENEDEWGGLQWWARHQKKFPNLSVMARQYLGVPVTSVSVERLFSQVGCNFTDKQKSHTAQNLESIIFCKLNT